jgi:hypothetical protein
LISQRHDLLLLLLKEDMYAPDFLIATHQRVVPRLQLAS